MIYGIGADILRVSRIGKVYARHGERFLEHVLHPKERAAFAEAKKPALFLAKAFAVKEAFVKALGTGFVGVAHEDVASMRDEMGKPTLVYSVKLKRKLAKLGIVSAHVTISDDHDWIVAMVVLETDGRKRRYSTGQERQRPR
ncbi:MAG TPA: holo-ACP synthase [Nevskiaceae bacterium]|nr:holo-ACP synthase [Nevskiaceae bacterium]